ncbi:Aspartic proteinase [Mycena kentingensis (nom. inval.)]|nr:Aspartic proteinase [Mycena kentingensis (nom. inval.)]
MLSPLAILPLLLIVLRRGASAVQTSSRDPISLPLLRKIHNTGGRVADRDRRRTQAFQSPNHRPAAPKAISPRSPGNVQAANAIVTYTVDVDIGYPNTTYTLLIDTGSANTWVGNDKPFTSTSAKPDLEHPGTDITVYGSGTFAGLNVVDEVRFTPNLVVHDQGIAVSVPGAPQGFPEGMDGILGIGPVALTRGTVTANRSSTVPTVVDNLYTQGSISSYEIGIYYEPTTVEGSVNGVLTFGGVDQTKFKGAIQYTSITSTAPASLYWGIDMSVSYGSEILPQTAGIVDTGTTLVLLASDALHEYQKSTGAVLDKPTGLLRITEAQFCNLKPLVLHIGGRAFTMTPDAQVFPRVLNTDLGGEPDALYLVVGDLGSSSGQGLDFIAGYTFLERFYSVYDTGNSRVGIAETWFTTKAVNFPEARC